MPEYHSYWSAQSVSKSKWLSNSFALLDSGAGVTAVHDKSLLTEFSTQSHYKHIIVGDGDKLDVCGKGKLVFTSCGFTHTFTDVLYVPLLKHHVMSISGLTKLGYTVTFDNRRARVCCGDSGCVMQGKLVNDLYVVDIDTESKSGKTLPIPVPPVCTAAFTSGSEGAQNPEPMHTTDNSDVLDAQVPVCSLSEADLWHSRLGHISKTTLLSTHKAVSGLPDIDVLLHSYAAPCESCLSGRFPAFSHTSLSDKPESPCALLYADLMGPFIESFDGYKYALCVIDAFSGYAISTLLKSKDNVCSAIKTSIQRFEMLSHTSVLELRTDYGTEFHNTQLMSFLSEKHIKLSHSAPYIHQQVGMVERFNRSVMEICRSLLASAHRRPVLWSEALLASTYIYNRRVSTSRQQNKTRCELFTGVCPDVSNMKVWGCDVFVKIPNTEVADKLKPKCVKGIFVGYDEYSPGYRVLINGKVCIRSDVVFSEGAVGKFVPTVDYSFSVPVATSAPDSVTHEKETDSAHASHKRERRIFEPTAGAQAVKARRLGQVHAVNKDVLDPALYAHTYKSIPPLPTVQIGVDLPIPKTYAEAITCEYAHYWIGAIESELMSITDMDVYDIVDLPPEKHALTSKWVFTWKVAEGKVVKAKARLVVRGFEQREGIDYTELYAPTVAQTTIRAVLATAAAEGWYVHQIDFKTAFLNGDLQEEVYMQVPEGATGQNKNKVWKLIKSLYGLKQAPRCWHKKLKERLLIIGFMQSSVDDALFYRQELDGSFSYLTVHVDDMLITHADKSIVLSIVKLLGTVCEITDCGQSHEYLGINIEHLSCGIFIHQSSYIKRILNQYLSHENAHASTPLLPNKVLCKLGSVHAVGDENVAFDDVKLYAGCIGSLMYIANFTRPDITYAVNQLCKYLSAPSVAHWRAAQHVVAYLHHSHDYGLLYKKGHGMSCIGYCDASFCCDKDTNRSVTGYCFMLNDTVFAWKSKQQSTVALSTAESEYMAISEAGRFGVHVKNLLTEIYTPQSAISIVVGEQQSAELQVKSKKPEDIVQGQLIYTDSMSALALVQKDHTTKCMKHISKIHHWARERVESGELVYKYVSGKVNVADVLTKFLPRDPFLKYRSMMGLVSFTNLMQDEKPAS